LPIPTHHGQLVRAIKSSKATYVAVHLNHPQISPAVQRACAKLIVQGFPSSAERAVEGRQ
jgi:L-lysine 2,3-aminomutase